MLNACWLTISLNINIILSSASNSKYQPHIATYCTIKNILIWKKLNLLCRVFQVFYQLICGSNKLGNSIHLFLTWFMRIYYLSVWRLLDCLFGHILLLNKAKIKCTHLRVHDVFPRWECFFFVAWICFLWLVYKNNIKWPSLLITF